MKTIREWLSELPESQAALKNLDPEMADKKVYSSYTAVLSSFNWAATPEGERYWDNIYEREKLKMLRHSDAPSFSSPSPHRLFEQIAEYVDKHDLKTYKILVTDGVAELITED